MPGPRTRMCPSAAKRDADNSLPSLSLLNHDQIIKRSIILTQKSAACNHFEPCNPRDF